MRIALAAAGVLLMTATLATAAEVPGTSTIDAVTVFPQGAEVTRLAKVKLAAGEHTVVISDLPAQAVAASIRVEGKANGRLDISSVDSRLLAVALAEAQQATTERRQLETEIERLGDERTILLGTIQAAEAQKALITNLAQLPVNPPGGNGTAQQPDWVQVFGVIGSRMLEAQRVVIGTQVTIREIDKKVVDLQRRLASLAPKPESRTEVKVHVSAAAPLEAELTIRYMTNQAAWTPLYDARLTSGTKTVAPKLTLTRRASIQQRSGEAWSNVLLTLSTARPAAGTSAPELRPLIVDYLQEQPRPMAAAAPPAPMVRRLEAPALEGNVADAAKRKDELSIEDVARTRSATVDIGTFQATFAIKDRVTIDATGEAKRVLADEIALEPTLAVRSVPRLDARAYLYAKVTLPRTAPYLAGPLSLFRDQTFVGNGRLPQLTAGEEHEIGFGQDDLVRVRYAAIDEKRGETGILTSTRVDQRNFRITIKSAHERPISYTIQDQIPASNQQDIKVEFTGRTAPTKRDLDDRRGVLAWEDKLAPEEERVLEFGYKVSWPAGKQINYNR